jgi:hypothetical protein
MRNGASISQFLQVSVLPRGARTSRVGSRRGSVVVFMHVSFVGSVRCPLPYQ